MIDSGARICLDACADGADAHESHAATASAKMVSLTADRIKRIRVAADVEMSDQELDFVGDALHKRVRLFGADCL